MSTSPPRNPTGLGHHGARLTLIWPLLLVGLPGCLPPPRMNLSSQAKAAQDGWYWWSVPSTTEGRGPVIGLEEHASPQRVRQWLLDDRGVRLFEYRRGRLADWGPPLSTTPEGDDFAVVRSFFRTHLQENAADRELRGSADVLAFLKSHRIIHRTDPPPKLTPHDIEQALVAAEITIGDLLQSGM